MSAQGNPIKMRDAFQEATEPPTAILQRRLYSAAGPLQSFVRTLSYWSFYEQNLPVILETALSSSKSNPKPLSILDVGCGTGELSIPVFDAMGHRNPSVHVTAVDPNEENLTRFRAFYEARRPKFHIERLSKLGFQEITTVEQYDVVVCSHSLYEVFESEVFEIELAANAIDKLRALTRPGGIYCVILASAESRAYEFKRQAYGMLGLSDQFYMTAREFRGLLDYRRERYTEKIVDTYVDSGVFHGEQPNARKEALEWLCYFLRVDCLRVAPLVQERLIELMRSFSLPFYALPEQLKEYYRRYPAACAPPSDSTMLLFHKESVFLAAPTRDG